MKNSKIRTLLGLFQPEVWPCLSIYIPIVSKGGGDCTEERKLLNAKIEVARKKLLLSMSEKEADLFLKKLREYNFSDLKSDTQALSLAFFCSEDFFWCLPIGLNVKPLCVVAKSFHLKPVVRWIEIEKRYYVLSFNDNICKLYKGRLSGISEILQVQYTRNDFSAVKNLIELKIKKTDLSVFIVTSRMSSQHPEIIKLSKEKRFTVLDPIFDLTNESLLGLECRRYLLKNIRQDDLSKVKEVISATHLTTRLLTRIDEISRSAVKGELECLIVSEEDFLLGEINPRSGKVKLFPFSEFLRADDILDDLVEIAGRNGAEVRIVPKSCLPNGSIALGLLRPRFLTLQREYLLQEASGY